MLSNAEIQYLLGQKHVSKSYERKLKCLIRKKVEVLRNELPLISSLLGKNAKSVFSEFVTEKEIPATFIKQEGTGKANLSQHSNNINLATKSSNGQPNEVNSSKKSGACEGLEGSSSSPILQHTTEATDFSNRDTKEATKNSNLVLNQRRERDLNPRGPHGPQAL
jgi:hypothetical protein